MSKGQSEKQNSFPHWWMMAHVCLVVEAQLVCRKGIHHVLVSRFKCPPLTNQRSRSPSGLCRSSSNEIETLQCRQHSRRVQQSKLPSKFCIWIKLSVWVPQPMSCVAQEQVLMCTAYQEMRVMLSREYPQDVQMHSPAFLMHLHQPHYAWTLQLNPKCADIQIYCARV